MAEAPAPTGRGTGDPGPEVDPALVHLLAGGDAPVPRTAAEARLPGPNVPGQVAAPEPVAEVVDRVVSGVPVRCYDPRPGGPAAGGRPLPLLVWIHGGGFVSGSIEAVDPVCRVLANRAPAVVVSVGYRLAPEHPFPAGLDDVEAVVRWAAGSAGELGADASRLGVGGTSAGGGLAAAVCLRLREASAQGATGCPIAAQALVYPCVDPRLVTGSAAELGSGYGLTREKMAWYWDQYLGGQDRRQPEAAPLHAEDLSGLPPALVVLAECDIMRDEGIEYARRLERSGVEASTSVYPGMLHGFLGWTGLTPAAGGALAEIAGFVAR